MRSDITPWTVRGMGLALGALIVIGLVQLGIAAGSVFLLLFIAILLASALEPIVGLLRDRLPIGRGATILVVYSPSSSASSCWPSSSCRLRSSRAKTSSSRCRPSSTRRAPGPATCGRPRWPDRSPPSSTPSRASSSRRPRPTRTRSSRSGAIVAESVVALASLLTIVFFWLIEHARLQRYTLAFLPAERRAGARDAWNEIETRLGLWVRGQLILMGAMGVATGITYTILGLPGALLLGVIAALTEAIPIVGPLLGAIPAILVAATVSPELALLVAVIYLVLQFVEGSVLVPMVMRNTVGISPLLVLVSLLIGAAVGGLVGAFLAVPVAASLEIMLSRLQAREVRVAQDPASIEDPEEGANEQMGRSLPDAANASAD